MSYIYSSARRVIIMNEDIASACNIKSESFSSNYNFLKRILYFENKEGFPSLFKLTFDVTHNYPISVFENYYNSFALRKSPNAPLLPIAVRHVDDTGTYYIERPPFRAKIDYKDTKARLDSRSTTNLEIWIPWTITAIPASFSRSYNPSNVTISYSYKQLESYNDSYVYSLYPNSHTGNSLCWSSSFSRLLNNLERNDVSSLDFDYSYWYSTIMSDYFGGGWNTDLASRSLGILCNNLYQDFLCNTNTENSLTDEELSSSFKNYIDKKEIKNKFPIYHKFLMSEEYPEFYQSLCATIRDQFGYSLKHAKAILSAHSSYHRSFKVYSEPNFVKFLVFMSHLSLEETINFYKEIVDFFPKNKRVYCSFKEIVANQKTSEDREDMRNLLLHPINTALSSDSKAYAASFERMKKYTFNILLQNPKTDHQKSCLYEMNDELFAVMYDMRIDIEPLIDFILEQIKLCYNNPEHVKNNFIVFDLEAKTFSLLSNEQHKDYLSHLKKDFKNSASNYVTQNAKKYKKYSLHSEKSYCYRHLSNFVNGTSDRHLFSN